MTIGRERRERETDNTYLVNQTDLVGKFITGIAEHTLSAGIEAAYETRAPGPARHLRRDQPCVPHQRVLSQSQWLPIGGAIVNFLPIENQGDRLRRLRLRPDEDHQVFRAARLDPLRPLQHRLHRPEPGAAPSTATCERTDNLFSYRFGAVVPPDAELQHLRRPTATPTIRPPSSARCRRATTPPTCARAGAEHVASKPAPRSICCRRPAQPDRRGVPHREDQPAHHDDPSRRPRVMVLDGVARVDGIELGAAGKLTDKWQRLRRLQLSRVEDLEDPQHGGPRPAASQHAAQQLHAVDHLRRHAEMDRSAAARSTSRSASSTRPTPRTCPSSGSSTPMISYKVDKKSTDAAQRLQSHRRALLRAVLRRPRGAGSGRWARSSSRRTSLAECQDGARPPGAHDGAHSQCADARAGRALPRR